MPVLYHNGYYKDTQPEITLIMGGSKAAVIDSPRLRAILTSEDIYCPVLLKWSQQDMSE